MAQPTLRRGARHPSLVSDDVLRALEAGAESANHMEQIALDMGRLLTHELPFLGDYADALREGGLVTKMRAGGRLLAREMGAQAVREGIGWRSDTARGWAAMVVGELDGLTLGERLKIIRAYANDPHFAVREWAWLSVRSHVADDVVGAIAMLEPWTRERSDRLRRFATEVTRPRGVWSTHIPALKAEPSAGLPVLEPLRVDSSSYVQDSVANWLNDASKHNPAWVRDVCRRWTASSTDPATARICRRALRTVERSYSS